MEKLGLLALREDGDTSSLLLPPPPPGDKPAAADDEAAGGVDGSVFTALPGRTGSGELLLLEFAFGLVLPLAGDESQFHRPFGEASGQLAICGVAELVESCGAAKLVGSDSPQ